MKTLNKTAAATFNALINSIKEGETHVKIDNTNGTFMPVSFELLYSDLMGKTQVNVYAMAHYYEQNGDLIADPDMTFAVDQNNPYFIVPMSFQDYRTYEASIVNDSDGIKIRMKMQADHTKFANLWLKNIKDQQGLKAVKPATTPEPEPTPAPEPTPPAPAPKSHKEFNIGDHVKFIDLPETVNGENNPLIDKIGVVVHSQKNDVNVLVEKFGCIGFLPENLEKIEKEPAATPPAQKFKEGDIVKCKIYTCDKKNEATLFTVLRFSGYIRMLNQNEYYVTGDGQHYVKEETMTLATPPAPDPEPEPTEPTPPAKPKKITLTTIKSFMRNNAGNLYEMLYSSFDGMVDGIEYAKNPSFEKVEKIDFSDRNLGLKYGHFVFDSRDYFKPFENENYKGYQVSNCCGSFMVAVKKQTETEPTPPAPDPEPEPTPPAPEPETKQPAAKFSPGEKVYLADDCSTYYTVENSKINENKERFYTINGNGRTDYNVPECDVLKITTDIKTGDQVTITGREFITGGKGKGKKNPYFGKKGTVSHIDGVHVFVNLQMSKTETICAGFTPEKVFLLQRAEATAPAPAPEPTPAPVAIQAPRTAKKDRPARRPKPAKQKLTEIYSEFCSFVDGYFVSTSLAY